MFAPTRRAFLVGAVGAVGAVVAHHKPGHGGGPSPSPSPTPTPTPSPTTTTAPGVSGVYPALDLCPAPDLYPGG